MFERNISKKVELLCKVYDHAKKTYKYGFRLLTLGWSDGNTFLPVNSCLLSSANSKTRINEAKNLDKRSIGFKRRKLAQTKATSVMLDLIDTAQKSKIPASYVLFDTWFCSPSSLIAIKNKKRRGRSKYLLSVEVTVVKNGILMPARIVYVRNKHKRKDYLALITTDMNISEEEAIRIYGKRWDIEVFFKVCI